MALRNAFADLATDDSLKAVKTSVDALKDSQTNASQKTKLIDTAGRVEKFKARQAKAAGTTKTKAKPKKK